MINLETYFCDHCEEEIEIKNCRETEDGFVLCEDCFECQVFICAKCEETFYSPEDYINNDEERYCDDCQEELDAMNYGLDDCDLAHADVEERIIRKLENWD